MLKRSLKNKLFYNPGFLGVFKSDWIVVSKNVFGFPKGPPVPELGRVKGGEKLYFCKNTVTFDPLNRFS
jgi:hypothetical protein